LPHPINAHENPDGPIPAQAHRLPSRDPVFLNSPPLLTVDPDRPESDAIRTAADTIRAGGLVAFPTETVYGLGGNALDLHAIARIFAAKGRPANNPVIVHVADEAAARALAHAWPDAAARLAAAYWPGPLTLVVEKAAQVPDSVTAGGPTVAIRVPSHPVALALVRAAGVPIAAPSANPSGHVSPTTAGHVLAILMDKVDLILDGGPTTVGLESTVVDVTCSPPAILRPGMVTASQILGQIGHVVSRRAGAANENESLRSPGLLSRHYAPRAILECGPSDGEKRVRDLTRQGERVGWLAWPDSPRQLDSDCIRIDMPDDARAYAAQLYAALHALDAAGVTRIVAAMPPEGDDWTAVRDRLARAAAPGS
jgi:L-threonylcarbamoyladenylate synthase